LTNGDFGTLLWRVNTTGNVQTVEALGNLVIIGGHFTSVDRVTRVRIAALSMTNGGLDPWPPRSRSSGVGHGRCS